MKNKIPPTTIIIAFMALCLIAPAITSVANAEWNLQVIDLSGNTETLSYNSLLNMPQTTVTADLYCYGLLVAGGDWSGVKLSDFFDQAQIDPTVGSILFSAQDGYTVIIPIDMAMRSDVIIAYEKDNVPLPETLRLVIPGANGNLWISMITSMNMSSLRPTGNLSQNFVRTIGAPPMQPTPQPTQTPQTTTPKNSTTVKPLVPPANSTQPESEQKATKQTPVSQNASFPVEVDYGAVIGLIVAVAAVGLVVYWRKNAQRSR